MRIAMIGSRGLGSSYGGIERVLNEICPRLVDLGHSIDVFSREDVDFADRPGLRAIPTPSFGGKHFETLTRSAASLARAMGNYDLVHFHAVGPGILTPLTRLFGQKSLVTIHGLDHEREKWSPIARLSLRLAEKVLARNADQISTVSDNLRRYFNERYDSKAVFIPNGIAHKQRVPPGSMMASFGLTPKRYVFFASRLTPEKGCHDLIQAFNELDTDMKLVIAGERRQINKRSDPSARGEGSARYIDSLRAKANPDRVVFVGHRTGDELGEFFSNAYLFALPSYLEGMSMALLEAMSYGIPALVSDIPENCAVVGNNGFYFEKKDVAGLQSELAKLIANPQIVDAMAKKLETFILPDWDDVARSYDALYRRIVEPKASLKHVASQLLESR
jgi:glycosyltransferase involved in cell wall biosynthesis